MDAINMIKERRSVRKYKPEPVDRETIREIVDISKWAPSWANFQVARYTFVDDPDVIKRFAQEAVKGFNYNIKTLQNAPGVAVLSFVKGKSGKLSPDKGSETNAKTNTWESFDAGIACQSFCLAAHAKGVGTCIFGVIDEEAIAKLVDLPKEETVAALIVYGWPDKIPNPTPRKNTDDILRFFEKEQPLS